MKRSQSGTPSVRACRISPMCGSTVASGNEFVTVDIDDDGKGISESDRARVFEPFQRLDDATSGHGVGLGLALVKRIVTQHSGMVEVLTSPLGGCRIRTTWPIGQMKRGDG